MLFSEKWQRALQLSELVSLQRIEQMTSTWVHFKLIECSLAHFISKNAKTNQMTIKPLLNMTANDMDLLHPVEHRGTFVCSSIWNLSLEAGTWALSLRFKSQGWNLSLEV